MAKNILIGVLVIAVLGLGGYMITRDNSAVETPSTDVPSGNNYTTPANVDTTPTPGVATVKTGTSLAVTGSTALVRGEVKPNGPATSYWFEYGETASLGRKTTEQGIGSGYTTLSAPGYITGLKKDTIYYFRIGAKNIYGTMNGSVETFKTNSTSEPVGKVPTSNTNSATDVERTGANLRGSVNPNGSSTNYWFEFGTDVNFGNSTQFQSIGNGTSSSTVSVNISGLNPLTKYYYRLNAQNQYGTVNGRILNFTTKGPANSSQPTVSTQAAQDVAATTAELHGRVTPNGASTTYWFEYSQDSLLGSLIGNGTSKQNTGSGTSANSVEADISNLARDTKYYYRLVAQNEHGIVRGHIMSFTTRK